MIVTNNSFNRYLNLEKRVSYDVIKPEYIQYFDNDGFELSYLEQEYYRENGVKLNNILNHSCDQREWIKGGVGNLNVDHSMILQRWSFVGEAKKQLEAKRNEFPQLNKYLNMVPKWGLDFALEYYKDDTFVEVFHIETDYRDYNEAVEAKEWFEVKLLQTDWEQFVKSLILNRDKWEHLPAMQQNDWKATYWGLNKAEITYKAFV